MTISSTRRHLTTFVLEFERTHVAVEVQVELRAFYREHPEGVWQGQSHVAVSTVRNALRRLAVDVDWVLDQFFKCHLWLLFSRHLLQVRGAANDVVHPLWVKEPKAPSRFSQHSKLEMVPFCFVG